MKNKKTKQLSIAELLSGASKAGPSKKYRAENMKATKTGTAKTQQLQIRKSGKK